MHFQHSVPVPRLYKSAAKICENSNKTGASVKNIIYQEKYGNIKALYALVVETLKHNKQLEFLLKRTKLLEKETRFNPWIAKVLITELLWRKKHLEGESKPVKTILAYQQVLNAHVSDLHENYPIETQVSKPRFVRVNTLLISIKDAIDGFRNEGWTFVRYMDRKNYDDFLNKVANLSKYEFMADIHVPEVLIFPQNTEFHSYNAYKNGLIILQDKSSCLPSHLLNPPPGSTVLDMCAAPGMKTSHLAAKLNNKGKVYAVDLNKNRLKTLETLMERNGVTCVVTINDDVLKVTPTICPEVKYILVDPSCSGSGIVNRLDIFEPTVKDENRLKKLRGFQIMILKHALRKYPHAQRVIYSTCSIYPEENEEVVEEVIKQSMQFKLINASELLKTPWHNFGSEKYGDIGKYCLYSIPEKDLTNGFFVAVFERLGDGEVNKHYVENLNFRGMKTSINDAQNQNNNNPIEDDFGEDAITESNNNENPENKSKRKKKKKPDLDNIKDELKKSSNGIQARNNEIVREKLSSTVVEVETDKENCLQQKKKKRHLQNDKNEDTQSTADNSLLTSSNPTVKDGVSVETNSVKKKRKKQQNKENIFDIITKMITENNLNDEQKDKCIIDKANDTEVLNTEENNDANNDFNSHKKKRKKHAREDIVDAEESNIIQKVAETSMIGDENKINKSKKKKREINNSKHEEVDIDDSFEKKKRKREIENTSEELLNLNSEQIGSINNLLEESEEIKISDKKKKKKKDKKKNLDEDVSDQNQTIQDEESLYVDINNIPKKTKKRKSEFDNSTNEEVNREDHLEKSKKNKRDRKSIVGDNKEEETNKFSRKNEENMDQNLSGDEDENMEQTESSKGKKKKDKKRKSCDKEDKKIIGDSSFKSMSPQAVESFKRDRKSIVDSNKEEGTNKFSRKNEENMDQNLSGDEDENIEETESSKGKKKHKKRKSCNKEDEKIIGDSSFKSMSPKTVESIEASGIKKQKKRRHSTVIDDSFHLENLYEIK